MRRSIHEQVLIYKIKRGDNSAFGPLYDFYVEPVYRFVYLKVPTSQDAEDITAQTFLKAWQSIKDQKRINNLNALIYQIARNLVADFYRSRGTIIESIEEQETVIADRVDLSLEEKMNLKSEMVAVEGALRQLKHEYREVIVLFYLNDLSLKEIADIIGRSPGATRVLAHRGLKALKNILHATETAEAKTS